MPLIGIGQSYAAPTSQTDKISKWSLMHIVVARLFIKEASEIYQTPPAGGVFSGNYRGIGPSIPALRLYICMPLHTDGRCSFEAY